MNNEEKLFVAEDLTKIFTIGGRVFGSTLVAVNKANFEIKEGQPEILTLAGESGSGKTTLARMLLGLLEPSSGRMVFKGNDITTLKSRKERLGFMREIQPVFQNPFESFNPLRKVDFYLSETALNYGIAKHKNEAKEIISEALRSVGLSLQEVQGRYPNEFSGGQLQRISIARALITKSSLLIADEPVSMVDASIRMSIINLLKDLKEEYGVSVVYITHDLATAYYISDRIAIMFRGDVVELGSVEKVIMNPLHPYTQALIESIPKADPDKRWDEEIKFSMLEVKEFSKLGCKFSDRCQCALDYCQDIIPEDFTVDGRSVRCHRFSEEFLKT